MEQTGAQAADTQTGNAQAQTGNAQADTQTGNAQAQTGNAQAQTGNAQAQTGNAQAGYAPYGIGSFGGVAGYTPTGYSSTGYSASTYDPTSWQASYQSYMGGPQVATVNPNSVLSLAPQYESAITQSLQPQFQLEDQNTDAASAARGIFNSTAATDAMNQNYQNQNATVAAAMAPELQQIQGYGQADTQANQAARNAAYSQQYAGNLGISSANQAAANAAAASNAGAANTAGQFNAGALNTAGQFNAGAANTANEFNAGESTAASAYDASATNTARSQDQSYWNNYQNAGLNQQYEQNSAAMQAYLASLGDTSATGGYNAGSGLGASAYTNAFNSQNASNGAFWNTLGEAAGDVGAAYAGK